jgi:ppGpp synthetase/RelA/SpoT-type nucleotidyltranferase
LLFEDQRLLNQELRSRVDAAVNRVKDKSWHFESRLKSEESFAVKVEAGMVADPSALEDFLAGVLVVKNASDVHKAESLLVKEFSLISRRPASADRTGKASSSFPFDDVRLYLKIQSDDALPKERSDGITFEIQVRTFLQHAWSVSTHDVVYKTDSVSWRRERIAHQIKAMLEHAEIAVESMTDLETSSSMPRVYDRYEQINQVIEILRTNWPDEALPTDLKRLATGILETAFSIAQLDPVGIQLMLDIGRVKYKGSHNLDWSPYRTVTQYLAEQFPEEFRKYVSGRKDRRPIYVYRDTLDYLGARRPASTQVIRTNA